MGLVPHCAHCGASVAFRVTRCPRCGVTLSGRDQATAPGLGYSAAPLATDSMIGRSIIDQFVVRRKLGEGGMGGVYVADQTTVGRTAVIKVIHPWLSKDPGITARFEAEARAAARLQNPHIVSIYNYGKLPDGTLFLAMEHIEGLTLAQVLQTHGRFEPSRAVAVAAQCCEALSEAHRRGVVHRDVKPSNIMLQNRYQGPGFVKMLDFGVAMVDDGEPTAGRQPTGTPCYMSPEQLAGKTVDARSDIYSLAVVIYELCVGQPPFLAPSTEEYARLHGSVDPPSPSALAPEAAIPPPLEACLMRALAKEPHARPQTAERFSEELWATVMSSTVARSVSIPIAAVPVGRRTASPAMLAGIGGLALATVAGAAYMLAGDDGPAQVPTTATDNASAVPSVAAHDPIRHTLERRSVGELEAELERAAVLTGRGSDTVAQAMIDYHRRAHVVPPGRTAAAHRRAVLCDMILQWARGAHQNSPPSSIAELEAIFLRMNGPLPIETRRSMLHELKDREGTSSKAIIGMLLQWIDRHGFDYRTGRPGSDTPNKPSP